MGGKGGFSFQAKDTVIWPACQCSLPESCAHDDGATGRTLCEKKPRRDKLPDGRLHGREVRLGNDDTAAGNRDGAFGRDPLVGSLQDGLAADKQAHRTLSNHQPNS